MLCVPAARVVVEHVAVRVLPLPARKATAEQPVIEVPPSVKLTVPVGDKPVTVAVKVTLDPTVDGLPELDTVVDVADFTACVSVGLVEPTLLESPAYTATMLRVPAASVDVAQVAVRILPLPPRATAEQPLIEVPPLVKFTAPVGARPLTVAVNVTLTPNTEGFAELARPVVVVDLTDCGTAVLVEPELPPSPP